MQKAADWRSFAFVPEQVYLRILCEYGDMDFFKRHPWIRIVAGILVFATGFIALVTPFTPGAIVLILLGLELLGLREAVLKKFKKLQVWWEGR